MRKELEDLPIGMQQPAFKVLTPGSWGRMVVEYFECSEQVDFSPMLKGLPNDRCPCPHWGYMVKGTCHMQYADGSEEVIQQGDVYYMPAVHTGWMEAGSSMIVFSPEAEARVVQEHLMKLVEGQRISS